MSDPKILHPNLYPKVVKLVFTRSFRHPNLRLRDVSDRNREFTES